MQSIYWLMANIKPEAMPYFDYSNAILYGMQDFNATYLHLTNASNHIDDKINQMNHNKHSNYNERVELVDEIWSHFIAMMEHYVKNSHKDHTNAQTFQLIK